jgi:hypothetical protein
MIDRKRLEKLEHAVPRRPGASSRAALAEMPEEELRKIVGGGVQGGADPTSEVAHRLREMSPEQLRSLARPRHGIRNQIGDREN